MASAQPVDEAAIREQAYLFWEQEGRPPGRDMEFWTRATVAIAEKAQMDSLTKPTPKKAKADGSVRKAAEAAAPAKSGKRKTDAAGKPKKK